MSKKAITNENTDAQSVQDWTDKYFTRSKNTLNHSPVVTYGVFIRRPCLMATKLAEDWLKTFAEKENFPILIQRNYEEGDLVGAGDPLLYITASMKDIVETETLLLQKIGATCVAAMNAKEVCLALPDVHFLAMDARHCAGSDMAEMMAYAASIGSKAAVEDEAKGFIGNATDATSHFFGNEKGLGTMPHALIGAYESTLEAAIAFREKNEDCALTVLVDYYGQEITDALAICNHFSSLAKKGELSIRLDTHGARYIEGLNQQSSYKILEKYAPEAFRGYRSEEDLKHLTGTGVSAAAIWHMREKLNENGFEKVKIVASSGFNAAKCRAMKVAKAPIDMIGTGSYLPEKWPETYATADIICYDGVFKVKQGRDFLIDDYKKRYGEEQSSFV
ncbi:MAG: nicotinate phosphoribosyltransferase [Pseudomonadota bacterium]